MKSAVELGWGETILVDMGKGPTPRMIDRVEWTEAEPVAVAAQRLARQERTVPGGLQPAVATF